MKNEITLDEININLNRIGLDPIKMNLDWTGPV